MSYSSPFQSVHERMGANFSEFDGWSMPADYGDAAAEKVALNENCAAFDLSSFGKIVVKGSGAAELVGKVAGLEAGGVSDGKWRWASAAGPDGVAIDVCRVFNTGGVYTIITSPSKRADVLSCVREMGGDGVEIEDITEKTGMLALYGPKAAEAVSNILPVDISGLEQGDVMKKSFFFISVTILRGSCVGVDGLELLCPVSAASMAAGAVEKYRDREGITPAGMNCLNESIAAAVESGKIPVVKNGG